MMTQLENAEISAIEGELGHKLPGLYRKLLVEEGFGIVDGREIYDPRQIAVTYRRHFPNQEELFKRYFPIGCDHNRKELWMVLVDDEKAASISHKTSTDDYTSATWLSYEDWVSKRLDC